MQAEEIFELVLRKSKDCEGMDHENMYLIIIGSSELLNTQPVLSYTELYNVLIDYVDEYSYLENLNDIIDKPSLPDPKYLHNTGNKTNCITYAAICTPLGPCLLSDYNDPLIKAYSKLVYVRRMVLEKILLNMTSKSIYYNNMPSFSIEPVPCYWYAKCAFFQLFGNKFYEELDTIGLEKTKEKGKEIIKQIAQNKQLANT